MEVKHLVIGLLVIGVIIAAILYLSHQGYFTDSSAITSTMTQQCPTCPPEKQCPVTKCPPCPMCPKLETTKPLPSTTATTAATTTATTASTSNQKTPLLPSSSSKPATTSSNIPTKTPMISPAIGSSTTTTKPGLKPVMTPRPTPEEETPNIPFDWTDVATGTTFASPLTSRLNQIAPQNEIIEMDEDPFAAVMLCSRTPTKELLQVPSPFGLKESSESNILDLPMRGTNTIGNMGNEVNKKIAVSETAPYLLSPKPLTTPSTKTVNGPNKNLNLATNTIVTNGNGNRPDFVVKYYYQPRDCPACITFAPQWNKLNQLFANVPHIQFQTVDATTPEGMLNCSQASVNGKPLERLPCVSIVQKGSTEEFQLRTANEDADALAAKIKTLLNA